MPVAKSQPTLTSWIRILSRAITLPILLLLLLYNVRRLLFSLATLSPRRTPGSPQPMPDPRLPDVLILVPCRDEEKMAPSMCEALAQLNYPAEKLRVVFIDDGSRDRTRATFEGNAQGKTGWSVFSIPRSIGKANALNAALERFSFGELVFIYDADLRPEPNSLRRAAAYFQDECVAGVSGRTIPSNGNASPAAYYATVENMVHQLVTMRAKDRLALVPALLGSNCGYRRACLAACGGFKGGALLEDSDLTLSFYRSGYRIRFAENALAYQQVPETVAGYLKQHIRWGRGFNDVSQNHLPALLKDPRLSPALRVELALFSTGYLDRIALMAAAILAVLSRLTGSLVRFPTQVLYFALVTPLIQIIALFAEQRSPVIMWRRLPWVPVFFALDIYAALRSAAESLLNRPRVWGKTERV